MVTTARYGTWSSPISAADTVAGVVGFAEIAHDDGVLMSLTASRNGHDGKEASMTASTRRLAVAVAGLLLAGAVGACAQEGTGETSLAPTSAPPVTAAPPEDGEHLGLVSVGLDESNEIVLGIDLAEMLTGEEAREAAVEEGFIGEDEELDTDFYISNPEKVIELVPIAPDAEITVVSGTDTSQKISVDPATFKRLYDGTYTGDPVYGIAAGQPVAMNLVIEDGMVSEAHAIYLP